MKGLSLRLQVLAWLGAPVWAPVSAQTVFEAKYQKDLSTCVNKCIYAQLQSAAVNGFCFEAACLKCVRHVPHMCVWYDMCIRRFVGQNMFVTPLLNQRVKLIHDKIDLRRLPFFKNP